MVDDFVNDFKQAFGSDILHTIGCADDGDAYENYIDNAYNKICICIVENNI